MNQSGTILVADDDRSIRTVVSQALTRAGYDVLATGTASGLWHWIENGQGDAVITDVVMPDADGLELLPKIRKIRPELPVIVMSAQNTLETAVKAAERGAYEYLPKPFDIDELTETVGKALTRRRAMGEAGAEAALRDKAPLVGRSPAMQQVYKVMARVMATDLTVLIQGESGTGKELVARALHDMGPRREAPFVAVNMAAIPRELIESELFGHEKGAFTGAGQRAPGRFAQAHKGTLFLDEIGDMPLEAQTRLLRVLQEGEYRSVGGRDPVSVDIRIVAASNRKLKALVRDGAFREDLFYRLNVVPLTLPPLRQRAGDIDDLARRFLDDAESDGLPPKQLDDGALEVLRGHSWPGNVRELENLIRRLCALHSEDLITASIVAEALKDDEAGEGANEGIGGGGLADAAQAHLARYFAAHAGGLPPSGLHGRVLREIETPLIELTLAATKGNQVKAAAILGLNRNTLRKKIRDLGITI
jgi:two-component system nitrogen regulation response regulator GlnG